MPRQSFQHAWPLRLLEGQIPVLFSPAGRRRTSTVENVNVTFREPEAGPGCNFNVSRNLPEATAHPQLEPRRKQVALLFADIVDSTELVVRLGDESWLALLASYYALVRLELLKSHGWYMSVAGDGFLAGFDQCTHAIRCSAAIRSGVGALGLRVRIGIHAGECVAVGNFLAGLILHIGARIASTASAGETLVSAYVKAQLHGSEIRFIDRGTHFLKGVPGEWRLFATLQT
jgi:class 3 adenylate cyclase